jgi:ABC-2 type transport system permease protein
MLAVLRRELAGYFRSPLGWLILTLFLFVQGYGFYLLVGLLSRPDAPAGGPLELFFGGTLLYWLFLIVIISALTMRLIASERVSGQLELLLSAPLSESALLFGKYFGALAFYCILWLPTLLYPLLLHGLAVGGSGIDWGPVFAGYFGTFLVGMSGVAMGLLWSTVAPSQILAAVATFVSLTLLLLVGLLELFVSSELRETVRQLSLFSQLEQLARGVVDTRSVFIHLTLAIFCLIAARVALGGRR